MSIQENKEMDSDQYKILIYSYLTNSATDEEKNTLMQWLNSSDENRKLFHEYSKVLDLTASISRDGDRSKRSSEGWERINSDIEEARPKALRRTEYFMRIAASAILFFSLGMFVSKWISHRGPHLRLSSVIHDITVPMGGKSQLVLPDGTKVWLNAGSHFRYKGDYGMTNRNVYLEGEGYFSVIKNPKKPFIVEAAGLKIKAFGTSFNVKAYPEEKLVTTTLVEGVVTIEGKGINMSLKPMQVVMFQKKSSGKKEEVEKTTSGAADNNSSDKNSLPAYSNDFSNDVKVGSNVDTKIYTSWKDNLWIIESESLRDIAVVLERKFNVNIDIESPELNQYKFTGTFNKETLEQILNVIKLTAPIRFEIEKGYVFIKEETKRKPTYNNFRQ